MRCTKLFIGILLVGLVACGNKEQYFPTELPKTSVSIERFDSALLTIDTTEIEAEIRDLYASYPVFMPFFTENILGIPVNDTAFLAQALPQFLNDTVYGFKQTNALVETTFKQIDDIHADLNGAFARLRYLYPNVYVPTIYFFVSGFNASVLFFEEDIAVGVDMYLGSDYEYYNHVVYNYQKQTMRKECIPVDIVSAYLFQLFPFTSKQSRLLENMIYRGKIMYVLSLLFPDEIEAEIMGYTPEQMAWCERNERAIWNMIMDKRDLFKTEPQLLTSYLNDGPFTAEISQDAPARLGTWIGWQICQSYMEHNSNITLQELLTEGDAQKILQESNYKP